LPDPPAVGALRAAGWQVAVIRPGDDLAAAWQRATARRSDFQVPVGRVVPGHPAAAPVRTA